MNYTVPLLQKYTDEELYSHYLEFKYRGKKLLSEPDLPYNQQHIGVTHDYWNAYDYGKEVKFVYFKCGIINHTPKEKTHYEAKEKLITDDKSRFASSISRARSRVFELAMCNEFQFFCTFTQDQSKRNRFDLTEFRKQFTQYVRNQNRSKEEKIKYVLIPEQHKDGAWHLHGLVSGLRIGDELRPFSLSEKIPLSIKKSIKNGKNVYNWEKYQQKFGFFTCTEIENKVACSRYITKYVSKDFQKTVFDKGEHLYFASQGLKRRVPIVLHCFEPCPVSEWEFENDYVKICTIKK